MAAVILSARLVDRHGKWLVPSAVCSIDYRLGAHRNKPNSRTLTVQDVLSSELQKDAAWQVDNIGYNFRHVLHCSLHEATFDVRYVVALVTGEITTVCFRVRTTSNDRNRTDPIHSQSDAGSAGLAAG